MILGAREKVLSHSPCVLPRNGFGRQLPPTQLQALYAGKAGGSLALTGLGGALRGCLAKAKAQSEVNLSWSLLCPGMGMVGCAMEGRVLPLRHGCREQISQKVMRETKKTSGRTRTSAMGSLEELGGQEGTFIDQRSSSVHSRGGTHQAEVCWGLCRGRGACLGFPWLPVPLGSHTHPQPAPPPEAGVSHSKRHVYKRTSS